MIKMSDESLINEKRRCNQQGCPFNTSGECLESISPVEECPYFYIAESNIENKKDLLVEKNDVNEDNSVNELIEDHVHLFSGEEIEPNEIKNISFHYPITLIMVIGESDSGKTTMLSTLFDLFQERPFADMYFSGSKTQIGFEKRCYLSRVNSGRVNPDTERTKSKSLAFLHLALRNQNLLTPRKHLLLSDVSGELFASALNTNEDMQRLGIIKKSDYILYIIDGKRLVDLETRQNAKTNVEIFIRRAIENGLINSNSNIDFAFSKWDLIIGNEKAMNFQQKVIQSLERLLTDAGVKANFYRISSRPEKKSTNNSIFRGFGLENLLKRWTVESSNSNPRQIMKKPLKLNRESEKYFHRFYK